MRAHAPPRLAALLLTLPLLAAPGAGPALGQGVAAAPGAPAAEGAHPAAAAAAPAGTLPAPDPSPEAAALPARGARALAPPPEPWTACRRAITEAETRSGLPRGLLLAIAQVESGRPAPGGGIAPWPFALNAEGGGRYPPTRDAAVAEVEALRARGVRSVDVGCMQVNLFHHPQAFESLQAAFDPATNVAYAVRFLRELFGRTGNWAEAIAQYHSSEPGRGLSYHSRVTVARVAGGTALATSRAVAGLCAPGLRASLVVARNGRPRMVCRGRARGG